ncbi:hypothetical protein KSC_018050 [Ktedonobacter sp. SOSP1-52]|nr:hypothetical protein KSC_018050 [Ktedonobacter sp. SOSP1-52]
MITQRFVTPFALATNEKDVWAVGIARSLMHHVVTNGLKCLRLKKIDDPFCARFGPYSFRMVIPIADDETFSAILDVLELKIEDFTWSQPSMEH